MAVGNYDYSELLNLIIDSSRRSNITNVITARTYINRAARRVLADCDLRSTKRRALITSKLFNDVFSYPLPSDIKAGAITDIIPQGLSRVKSNLPELVTERNFDRKKNYGGRIVAFSTDDLTHRLLYNGNVSSDKLIVANFESTTEDGGTWAVFGDAENIVKDSDNGIVGNSLKWDISGAAGTTAGLQNTGLTTFDITNYRDNGSVLVWVYINSTTNLTNWILRIGNDASNYLTQTKTTDIAGNAFVNGWNLLKFDFVDMTLTGTVTSTTCDYIALYMTKAGAKADDGYRFDYLVLHSGEYHDLLYYSRYPWQSSAGTFLEDSTADTDLLNAETDEIDLFVYKGKEELFRELRRWDLVTDAKNEYNEMLRKYKIQNPSERLRLEPSLQYNPTLYFRKF